MTLLKSFAATILLFLYFHSGVAALGGEAPWFASPPKWYQREEPYPPPWARTLPWAGELKIRFAPGWGDTNSPFFWSYVLLYWLKGDVLTNRTELEQALHGYDVGLYGKKFSPERIKLVVEDRPSLFKLGHAVTTRWVTLHGFDAEMTQRELTTHLKTFRWYCPESDRTALVILRSPHPFETTNEVWTTLSTFWDTAACHNNGSEQHLEDRILRVETNLPPAIVIQGENSVSGSIQERMSFYKTPGVSVAVINHGMIEWARGYGVGEAGTSNRITTETTFQAASISKAVTALVTLRLVESGRLKLDEDVNQKLVSWKVPDNEFTREKKVTLRGLLSHSSGLSDRADFQGFAFDEPYPSLVEILDGAKPGLPGPIRVDATPGSRWRYSNGGYCVVEQLIMDVTRQAFPMVAREQVLTPLGMAHSSFEQPLPPDRAEHAASGHRLDGLPVKGGRFSLPEAVGGLWTTPSDLARFAIEIQNARAGKATNALSRAMAEQMLSRQYANWGLGLGLDGEGRAARFFHSGSVGGFECNLEAYVETGQGAVVMTSGSQGWRLAREILGSIAQEYQWPGYNYSPEVKTPAKVAPLALDRYVGRYRLQAGVATTMVIEVTRDGTRLFGQSANDSRKVELFPLSEARFFILENALNVTFVRDASGKVSEMVSDQGWRAEREVVK